MKKVTAIGFRSNSWYAGLNTTIQNSDIPQNINSGMGIKMGNLLDKHSDEYKATQLIFPLEGKIIEDEDSGKMIAFVPNGYEDWDWYHVDHFVFEEKTLPS